MKEKYKVIIGVTIILAFALVITVAMFTKTPRPGTHIYVTVKGDVTEIIDDTKTTTYDYYKFRVQDVLTSDTTTRNFLQGTYMTIYEKEDRYKKGETVTKDIKIPIH
jgi:hypothetical protein